MLAGNGEGTDDVRSATGSSAADLPVPDRGQHLDENLVELRVAGALENDNFEAAQSWMEAAGPQCHQLPAWERLSLALSANDVSQIEAILANEGEFLAPADRVQALRKLGRDQEALAVVQDAEAQPGAQEQRVALEAHAKDLGRSFSQSAEARWSTRTLGELHILSEQAGYGSAQIQLPLLGPSRTNARFIHNDLSGNIADTSVQRLSDKYDAVVPLESQLGPQHEWRLLAGSNVREGGNLP